TDGHQAAAPQVGDPQAGEAKANGVCLACHGPQGNSLVPIWPKLAGQHPEYIVKQLMDFKQRRANEQMTPMAMPLTDQEVLDLAAYYATQPKTPGAADPELASKGESLYRWGNPETGVPACSGCHGPAGGAGQSLAKFPRLSAQHADYTKQTLEHFRGALRANDPNGMMRGAAARLSDQEIAAVSQYLQGLSQ
uniref:Cytochrome c4 n=1 Tax=Thiocapsa roseopersicina TaxID=1058 RepID=CYC4_THIRO|nr:RecName: Full=Cytochrome c4 [Thiocapsa roseopersicina]